MASLEGVEVITKERLLELRKAHGKANHRYQLDKQHDEWISLNEILDAFSVLLRKNERLSGKTGCCIQCEAYAKENEELKEKVKVASTCIDMVTERRNKLERVAEAADHYLNGVCLEETDKRRQKLVEALQALRGKP